MPLLSQSDIHSRAIGHASQDAKQMDPITLLIIGAILSAIISHLVSKCLNSIDPVAVRSPGIIQRWKFRRFVRNQCGSPDVVDAANRLGFDPTTVDREFGDMVYAALLKTGAEMTEPEVMSFRRGN